jgi:hypothetical protein
MRERERKGTIIMKGCNEGFYPTYKHNNRDFIHNMGNHPGINILLTPYYYFMEENYIYIHW